MNEEYIVTIDDMKDIWALVAIYMEMKRPDLSTLNILMHKRLGGLWYEGEMEYLAKLKGKYLTGDVEAPLPIRYGTGVNSLLGKLNGKPKAVEGEKDE